ncbi:translation initiation factor IF-2, chloroplastic-like protein [Corchorus olitorius]|uniref:Translation initiation factor IF-2, chloroplastic-like protein n=1 Tax=Corchorus olitorius TaxID=93759 RepID=A0A1R3KPR4_9ROSI|nr:translation initiation factor IF-2, chloroplastic-like protein [Corchorus olitorius]
MHSTVANPAINPAATPLFRHPQTRLTKHRKLPNRRGSKRTKIERSRFRRRQPLVGLRGVSGGLTLTQATRTPNQFYGRKLQTRPPSPMNPRQRK